jgi:hypothetical protein
MADKTPNYSPAQETLILNAIRANGNIANKTIAEQLAADPAMDGADGPRKPRAITAKMSRMKVEHGFEYERKAPVSKTGAPIQKKLDLVAKIARMADVSVASLDNLDKASKGALEVLADLVTELAERREDEAEAA